MKFAFNSSDPAAMMSSANGTRLDQMEENAMRLSAARHGRTVAMSSLCGHIAECFSAGPLAAVAAVLLNGRLPRLYGSSDLALSGEPIKDFVSLATDYSGLVAGVHVSCESK